jgi:hypothetical protein
MPEPMRRYGDYDIRRIDDVLVVFYLVFACAFGSRRGRYVQAGGLEDAMSRALRAVQSFTSRPMSKELLPHWLLGLPDPSTATGDSAEDWFNRWIRSYLER